MPVRTIETVAVDEEPTAPAASPAPPAPPEAPSPVVAPRDPLDRKDLDLGIMLLSVLEETMKREPHFFAKVKAGLRAGLEERRFHRTFGAVVAAERQELETLRATRTAEGARLDGEIAAKQGTLRDVCARVAAAEDLDSLQRLLLQTRADYEAAQAQLAAVRAQLDEAEKALDLAHLATQRAR